MALIKCTECGQMISDKASKCPKCGCPIIKQNVEQHNVNMNQQPMHQPVYYDDGNRGNSNKWLYAVIALLVAALAGGGYYFYDKNKQVERDIQQQQQKFANDSIARDSIAKVEQARQESAEKTLNEEEKKQNAEQVVTAAPQFYGQVSDPDGYTNIRRGPGTNYPIVRQYNSGDYLYYTPQNNGWSLVYSGDKASTFMGYMHTSRIVRIDPNQGNGYSSSSTNSNSSGNYNKGYIVDPVDDYVNVRKGPGTNYSIVGRLNTNTNVYYTTTGSNWYKVYDSNYNYLGYVYHDRIIKTKSSPSTQNRRNEHETLSWLEGNWRYQMTSLGEVLEMRVGISGETIVVFINGSHHYSGRFTIEGNRLVYNRHNGMYEYLIIDKNNQRLMADERNPMQRF